MSRERIEGDLRSLAGRLTHRGPNTDSERTAAEYVRDRLRESVADADIDDFFGVDSPWMMFASCYAEFVLVTIVATWWPRLALCYGAAVFIVYLAEFMGYELMSRFLPQYETQNVVARMLAPRPRRMLVVMAHYDSGHEGPLESPRFAPYIRWLHAIVVAAMVAIMLSCAAEALGIYPAHCAMIRWVSAGILIAAACALAYNAMSGDYVRGANDNASGATALLELARRLAAQPIEDADIHLVATGSNKAWMIGARHYLTTHHLDRETTFILNLDSVGDAALCYTIQEGMLHLHPSALEMVEVAARLAPAHAARPHVHRAACSDALMALTRGYKAMTITSVDAGNLPESLHEHNDTLANVDSDAIARATDFAEAILRELSA